MLMLTEAQQIAGILALAAILALTALALAIALGLSILEALAVVPEGTTGLVLWRLVEPSEPSENRDETARRYHGT